MSRPGEPARVDDRILREWPLPAPGGSKNARGRVVVIGGSEHSPGAVMLAGIAALRVGAGRLTLVTPPKVALPVAVAVPEAGVLALGDGGADAARDPLGDPVRSELAAADAVLLGPGLDDPAVSGASSRRCARQRRPAALVLDAFALGVLPELDVALPRETVLSPNLEEAGILLGEDRDDHGDVMTAPTGDVDLDVAATVARIADRYGAVTTCYGEIAAPGDRAWHVEAGGPGLGTSGSGDVLAGAIAGLLARGADAARPPSGRPTCTRRRRPPVRADRRSGVPRPRALRRAPARAGDGRLTELAGCRRGIRHRIGGPAGGAEYCRDVGSEAPDARPTDPVPLRAAAVDRDPSRAHWMELFFDLIFVALVGQLAHGLHEDPTIPNLVLFVALFASVWWSWVNLTFAVNIMPWLTRRQLALVMLAAMFALGAIAVAAPEATTDRAWLFAAGNAALRIVLLTLWISQSWGSGAASRIRVLAYNGATAAIWLVSIWVPTPWNFVLWGVAIVIEVVLLVASSASWADRVIANLNVEHLSERFGLLVVIVLGESVLSMVAALDEAWTIEAGITAVARPRR